MSLPTPLLEAAIAARRFDSDDLRAHALGVIGIRKDGAVIRARNCSSRLPEQSGHAEARAIRKMDKGGIMYVARVTKGGRLALAKPCRICELKMRSAGVVRCYYTISDHEFGVLEL